MCGFFFVKYRCPKIMNYIIIFEKNNNFIKADKSYQEIHKSNSIFINLLCYSKQFNKIK